MTVVTSRWTGTYPPDEVWSHVHPVKWSQSLESADFTIGIAALRDGLGRSIAARVAGMVPTDGGNQRHESRFGALFGFRPGGAHGALPSTSRDAERITSGAWTSR